MQPRHKKERKDAQMAASARRSVLCEGLVILDEKFLPIALDGGAEAILEDLNENCDRSHGTARFPQELLNLLMNIQGEEQEKHLHLSTGEHEYSCQTFELKWLTNAELPRMLACHFKLDRSITDAVQQVGVDYNLTDREQEALIGVTMGLTSKELATRMDISPNTVKAFLRLIMVKMGVTTRAGIVGKVLEQSGY